MSVAATRPTTAPPNSTSPVSGPLNTTIQSILSEPTLCQAFLRVADANADHLALSGFGEILVGGVTVMPGYFEDAVRRGNQRLARIEQAERRKVLDHDWVPGGDELTPTAKLRRRPVEERYAKIIEGLYA
ncbi:MULTISPECIES: hypothetical protein [unclassified Frankia]|uniref:hypothetical protein n=1 Tax=unclassified Frankia TaxID=2632575 RepID=UPI0020249EB1